MKIGSKISKVIKPNSIRKKESNSFGAPFASVQIFNAKHVLPFSLKNFFWPTFGGISVQQKNKGTLLELIKNSGVQAIYCLPFFSMQ